MKRAPRRLQAAVVALAYCATLLNWNSGSSQSFPATVLGQPQHQKPTVTTPPQKVRRPPGEMDCALDIDLHRPISQDDNEPVVPETEELTPGDYTLRNDDADAVIGANVDRDALPVSQVKTDIDRQANPQENDLIRLDAKNPMGLNNVFLFAFALEAERDRKLDTPVRAAGGRKVGEGLANWTDAIKTAPGPAYPVPVPGAATRTFWVEGTLGGRYRFVIGVVPQDVRPSQVKYDVAKGETEPALQCARQATLNVVVVDIYQRDGELKRETAFDVYWGGLPYFEAQAWPGGGQYQWGADYKQGRTVRQVPATAVTGRVAFMEPDGAEGEKGNSFAEAGEMVTAIGAAPARNKAVFAGGFEVNHPLVGNVPRVTATPDDRYPDRITVAYTVEQQRLVRMEPLEAILPQLLERPTAIDLEGSEKEVLSRVQYQISDAFRRRIRAPKRKTYIRFYGAGLKAWEALDANRGTTVEVGARRDDVQLAQTPPNTPPFKLGTAQRSQAAVEDDRMTEAAFRDRLRVTLPDDRQARELYWLFFTRIPGTTGNLIPRDRATIRQEAADRSNAYRRAGNDQVRLAALRAEDDKRVSMFAVFSIPQDVILQLRAGNVRYDINVLEGNTLEVFAPYFFETFPAGPNTQRRTYRYNLRFRPGMLTSKLVDRDHKRPPP